MLNMSLEEFLDLPTPNVKISFTGSEWARYQIAKKSFETYGDNPPCGPVEVLVSARAARTATAAKP